MSAVTRAFRFHGTIFQERLESVLQELVSNRTNSVVKLMYVGLLNTNGEPVVAVGDTNLFSRETLAGSEIWFADHVTLFAHRGSERQSRRRNQQCHRRPARSAAAQLAGIFRGGDRARTTIQPASPMARRHQLSAAAERRNGAAADHLTPAIGRPRAATVRAAAAAACRGCAGCRTPSTMRSWPPTKLHGLVLAMSTDNYRAVCTTDLWLRFIIGFFAGISALGAGLAWRNMGRTAELQIRLVRASELNSHLKELNLAAAGLAHETRNPLNIIRGQAQMLSRLPEAAPEVREKSRTIVDETDKVTAQLTEFINYSRPREVRRTRVVLTAAASEIVRTLGLDIEEKKLRVEVGGEALAVEADEQLLRQVLFNLLINAIQAVDAGGKIQVLVQRAGPAEAVLEVRDDGPGVPPENRREIFKPYFTTHQKGTGLGLAVVQQIVLAHGWEIACLGNEPRGAVFRDHPPENRRLTGNPEFEIRIQKEIRIPKSEFRNPNSEMRP